MASLPILSGRDVVKAFAKDGWQMVRQRGSHMATLSVPDHREIARLHRFHFATLPPLESG